MPNWCYNTVKIRGPKRELDKFEKHLTDTKGENWFSYFVKPDHELADDEWYGWNLENYGCKWNCDASDWHRDDDESIGLVFDSPWGPPIALYQNIENIELESESGEIEYYSVEAKYLEEGMGFMGQFVDSDDEYFEYSDLESLDDIPEELVEYWGVRDRMLDDMENEDYGDDEEEIEDEGGPYSTEEVLAELDKIIKEQNEGTPPSDEEFKKQEETLKKTMKD